MTGLRERQKERRRREILDAAANLFKDVGYERTTMEDIAASVEISPPTLYRFYPSKSALLIGFFYNVQDIYEGDLRAYCEAAEEMGAIEAIAGLLNLNNTGISAPAERKLWREVMAAVTRIHDAADDDFQSVTKAFEAHIENLLIRLCKRSALSPDIPINTLVGILYAIANENFHRIIANQFDSEKAAEIVVEQVTFLLTPWVI